MVVDSQFGNGFIQIYVYITWMLNTFLIDKRIQYWGIQSISNRNNIILNCTADIKYLWDM